MGLVVGAKQQQECRPILRERAIIRARCVLCTYIPLLFLFLIALAPTCTHTHTHICMHARTHADRPTATATECMHARTHADRPTATATDTHTQTHMHAHTQTHVHTHTDTRTHVHTHKLSIHTRTRARFVLPALALCFQSHDPSTYMRIIHLRNTSA